MLFIHQKTLLLYKFIVNHGFVMYILKLFFFVKKGVSKSISDDTIYLTICRNHTQKLGGESHWLKW